MNFTFQKSLKEEIDKAHMIVSATFDFRGFASFRIAISCLIDMSNERVNSN